MSIYQNRDADFDNLCKLHKTYLGQITIHTAPDKVKDRIGELREFVKKADRLMFYLSYDRYYMMDRMKKCAEMIAHWKTVAKIVTGDAL